jgi:hypothetical protein
MKIFVIAGTGDEARQWINGNIQKRANNGETTYSLSDYVYVSSVDNLRGTQNPHGVFIGNWLGRPDIMTIVEQLMVSSTIPNSALYDIYKDLKPKVRPTPIYKGSGQQAINNAARLLSDAIDAEALKQVTQP